MEEVNQILDDANMVTIAEDLLERYSSSELDSFPEQGFKKYCDPYDAAIIVALAKQIETNRRKNAN